MSQPKCSHRCFHIRQNLKAKSTQREKIPVSNYRPRKQPLWTRALISACGRLEEFNGYNFSRISLQNLASRGHKKQKIGSARKVTHQKELPFFGGTRVILLFLHINTLAHPAGSAQSRLDNQSMRERCCLVLTSGKGVKFSVI